MEDDDKDPREARPASSVWLKKVKRSKSNKNSERVLDVIARTAEIQSRSLEELDAFIISRSSAARIRETIKMCSPRIRYSSVDLQGIGLL